MAASADVAMVRDAALSGAPHHEARNLREGHGGGSQRPSSRIIAAPFSAIMMVGELVLPEVIVGITEASITRMFSRPNIRRRSSTTAIGSESRPIFAVPTG